MKNVLAYGFAAMVLALGGCQGEMRTIAALDNALSATQPVTQTIKVTEKGTYYLYSSKDPKTAIYQTDLKRGEELGFRVTGNRAIAIAKGILVELSDYSEGASYQWKLEEKRKD